MLVFMSFSSPAYRHALLNIEKFVVTHCFNNSFKLIRYKCSAIKIKTNEFSCYERWMKNSYYMTIAGICRVFALAIWFCSILILTSINRQNKRPNLQLTEELSGCEQRGLAIFWSNACWKPGVGRVGRESKLCSTSHHLHTSFNILHFFFWLCAYSSFNAIRRVLWHGKYRATECRGSENFGWTIITPK